MANGLTIWSGRWAMESCTNKMMLVWGMALWKLLWEFKEHIKVGGTGESTRKVIHGKTVKRILRAKRAASSKSLRQSIVKEGQLGYNHYMIKESNWL